MKFILPFLLLLSFSKSYGQVNRNDTKLSIHTTPLSLIDYYSGMYFGFGGEVQAYKNIYIGTTIGYYIPKYNGLKDAKGWNYKPEIKLYINKKQNYDIIQKDYLSVEFFYKNQTYSVSDSIWITESEKDFKNYSLTKYISAWSIKYGGVMYFKSGFLFEYYFGLGRRNKNVITSLTKEEDNSIDYEPENSSFYNGSGKSITANFIFGIKVGFIIK